jgi:hypothetical protein
MVRKAWIRWSRPSLVGSALRSGWVDVLVSIWTAPSLSIPRRVVGRISARVKITPQEGLEVCKPMKMLTLVEKNNARAA